MIYYGLDEILLIEAHSRGKNDILLHLRLISYFGLYFTNMAHENPARSCDTFVVLPPLTDSNFRIFGKNSDRPTKEVQEVIFVSKEHSSTNKDHVQVRVLSNFSIVIVFPLHLVHTYTNSTGFHDVSMYSIETCLVLGSRNGCE